MDISETLAPKSDQLDAVDLLGGPQTFTVVEVTKTDGEQPLSIRLAEFPRVWRPSKNMRRVLGYCWGTDASVWAGRRFTLFCDPKVRFGGEEVGGSRISHLSHIDHPVSVPLVVGRGKSGSYKVLPLVDEPTRDWHAEADALTDKAALGALWREAPTDARDYIAARAKALTEHETDGAA